MSQQLPVDLFNRQDSVVVTLPAFRNLPSVDLDFSRLKESEKRMLEAKIVTPSTYSDLEMMFSDAYREVKRNLATVSYQIMKTEQELNRTKSVVLLDEYPEFLKDKPAKYDTAMVREAYISRNPLVQESQDRLDSLKALEIFLDGRVKVLENVSRFMKKQMDLTMASGSSNIYLK